jgi:glycosyltransferase involved in cell wall biosynthesis
VRTAQRADRPKVVYWNNQPAPYVVDRLNAVMRLGTIDLEAWFDTVRLEDRQWDVDKSEWLFPARFVARYRMGSRQFAIPATELREVQPDLLIQTLDQVSNLLGVMVGRREAGRVTLRLLPTFRSWVPHPRRSGAARHLVYRGIDGAKISGHDAQRQALQYGLPADRTWKVIQGIQLGLFGSARDVTHEERSRRRRDLGVDGCVFIYVGRLWRGKGVDVLIEAFRRVSAGSDRVSLVLVGTGPDEAELRSAASGLERVVFVGHRQRDDLPALYASADALVFPTLGDPNGLVVEEAMAAGLPVIATTAAGDIRERVRSGVNGTIVEAGSVGALAGAMEEFAHLDSDGRRRLGRAALEHAAAYTPEAYAVDFERFVLQVLAMPRRRGASAAVLSGAGGLIEWMLPRLLETDLTPPVLKSSAASAE